MVAAMTNGPFAAPILNLHMHVDIFDAFSSGEMGLC
jgi:hypothetical protein